MLGNDRETNNETMTIALQQIQKYATALKPLPGSGPRATIKVLLDAVFSTWFATRLYHSTDRLEIVQCI
jgi:hypothetical protein